MTDPTHQSRSITPLEYAAGPSRRRVRATTLVAGILMLPTSVALPFVVWAFAQRYSARIAVPNQAGMLGMFILWCGSIAAAIILFLAAVVLICKSFRGAAIPAAADPPQSSPRGRMPV